MEDSKKLQDLNKIKEWLSKQPHLPTNIEEKLLSRFLHTCNNSLEQSKYLIDLFFTIRSQAPEIFANRNPFSEEVQNIFKAIDMVPLPKPTKENNKIFIYRIVDHNPEQFNYVASLKTFFMISDTRMRHEMNFPNGEIPIFDMSGFTLKHLTKIQLPVMKKYMTYTQEAHPIRLKQIHIINVPPFLDRCLAVARPFMKAEVASLLHFHQPNSETLYDYVPRNNLPEEYGGTLGKISDFKAEWIKLVEGNRDYFMDESRWTVDENKRPQENQNGVPHFGIQGSFRTLSID